MATSSLARQSTPLAGARLDRTAAHAAVRNLAESYGVDLLPLELSLMADLDAPTQVNIQRRCSEPGGPPERQLSSPADFAASHFGADAATPAIPEAAVTPPQRCSPADAATTCSPRLAGTAAESNTAAAAAAAGYEGAAALAATDGLVAAEQTWLGSSGDADDFIAEGDEEEYLEYDVAPEQRIALLEEERDILVDKLLATTEALHASEARNRQSQASASQVGALLNQLQELLRRAEVERDRAKLQLKRQRVSASQQQGVEPSQQQGYLQVSFTY
ncbi:hypothetical protein OEZ85_007579 [Tetradesmus obliquus]|uniref:Uncharacterized protein n=1 Tax=Tetradesmus obliquus TaxID=3088 RepID=A0ABY8TII9_TETOB|nr:hypothetical protein OEZ85_007579 [Tetradesmus obliquus]